jgi:transposase
MLTIGLDAHASSHSMCILDDNGKRIQRTSVRGGMDSLLEALAQIAEPFRICFEASVDCGTLHDRIAALPHAAEILVAHPNHLRPTRTKNDRVDAERLAKLAYLGQVPRVHVPDAATRERRQLAEFRARLVRSRTRVKNGIKSLLRGRAVRLPECGLWTKAGRAWLRALQLPDAVARLRLRFLRRQLRLLDGQVRDVAEALDAIAADDPRTALLRTVPGVGRRTAEAFVAWVDDPKRFARSSRVGSYFGLAPRQNQSGDRNHMGGIMHTGPSLVRWLLVEAAWRGIRRDDVLRHRHERIMRGDPQRRRRAVVAVAHHMARSMFAMLRTGEVWTPDGARAPAQAAAT